MQPRTGKMEKYDNKKNEKREKLFRKAQNTGANQLLQMADYVDEKLSMKIGKVNKRIHYPS